MLIILSKSLTPEDSASILDMAARLAEKGERIAILHIQDACSAVASKEHCDRLLKSKIKVYALKADVEARELAERMHQNAKIVDYKQWVSLMMNEHDKIVSWTS